METFSSDIHQEHETPDSGRSEACSFDPLNFVVVQPLSDILQCKESRGINFQFGGVVCSPFCAMFPLCFPCVYQCVFISRYLQVNHEPKSHICKMSAVCPALALPYTVSVLWTAR